MPVECRACDAGIHVGKCVSPDVICSTLCSVRADEYVGETERTIRKRFEEHCREARARAVDTPWGEHYAHHHPHHTLLAN